MGEIQDSHGADEPSKKRRSSLRMAAYILAAVAVVSLAFAAGWYDHTLYYRAALTAALSQGLGSSSPEPSSSSPQEETALDAPSEKYSPDEAACPNARRIGQTKRTGEGRTKYF
jgi:hypothetical protein